MELDQKQKTLVLGMARNGMSISKTARDMHYSWSGVMCQIEKIQRNFRLNARDFYDLCKLVDMAKEGD